MNNLPEVCSIQGCRLVELDIVIYVKLSKTSSYYTVFHAHCVKHETTCND